MSNLDKLVDKLREVANRDSVISAEEDHIINRIRDFIRRYNNFLDETENGNISEEDRQRLKEMKREILEGAWIASMENGEISDDESELISTIYEFLKQLRI